MPTLTKVLFAATLAAPFAMLAACSSSSSSSGTAGATTTTSSNSSTTSSTASTTTGTGGGTTTTTSSSSDNCQANCIANNQTAYEKFAGDQLTECGCKSGAACASDCTAECADPTTLTATSACGMCLNTEGGKGLGSACTTAAVGDCAADNDCKAFTTCVLACP